MKQTILTFITKVNPDRVSDLKTLLDGMGADVEHNPHIPFPDLKLLHFASLVLNDDPSYGACLVFENNFDGSLDLPLHEDKELKSLIVRTLANEVVIGLMAVTLVRN